MGINDKIDAKTDQAKGKVKEELGEKFGDRSTELEGKGEQAKGEVKEGWENVKDAADDVKDAARKATN